MTGKQMTAKAEREAAAWNKRHPVGTVVRYWSLWKKVEPTGTAITTAPASLQFGTAVVRVKLELDHRTDLIALTHVEAVS